MTDDRKRACPECVEDAVDLDHLDHLDHLDRRDFIRILGSSAVAAPLLATSVSAAPADKPKPNKPAEDLVREFHATLTADQKQELVLPWNHGADGKNAKPSRLRTYNSAILGKRLAAKYSKPQQELIQRTLRAVLSSDDALKRMSRNGTWDNSRSFDGNGCVIFGDPTAGQFSWVFAGHHLTVRCDGNSEPGAAFGGPMYYGHTIDGHSERNVYNYQTRNVQEIFDVLDEAQQAKAIAPGNPGDRERGIQFRAKGTARPGIAYSDLKDDQRTLVASVMRVLLDPFRKEDGDEVMQLIKSNGGMEKIHLAFYRDAGDKDRWSYWRLEGPGFIWNYRVLPHVHCYVNIVSPT